jgi:CheY-like chemotaxis protein
MRRYPDCTDAKVLADLAMRQAGVLLVGMNSLWLRTLEYGLRAGGQAVWVTGSTADALQFYSAPKEAIDLVLIDVQSSGMNPAGMLVALRQINPHASCCVVITELASKIESRWLEAGAAQVIQKPLRLAEFDTIIAGLAKTRLHQSVNRRLLADAILGTDTSDA